MDKIYKKKNTSGVSTQKNNPWVRYLHAADVRYHLDCWLVQACLPSAKIRIRHNQVPHLTQDTLFVCSNVWFDSLRPINNLSVIKGWVFLGWTSTELGLMFLLKDTTQWRPWGSNPQPLGLESSTLPLSHCTPQDTLYQWESDKLTVIHHKRKLRGQPFPSRWPLLLFWSGWSGASVSDMHDCRHLFVEWYDCWLDATVKDMGNGRCNCYRHGWWSGANVIYMDADKIRL